MTVNCDKPIRSECVHVGDSTDNLYFRATNGVAPDVSTCRQAVYPQGSTTAAIGPAAVTGTETIDGFEYFEAFLTPAQTTALAPGSYEWVVEITGDGTVDPPFTEEVWVNLHVVAQRLPAA